MTKDTHCKTKWNVIWRNKFQIRDIGGGRFTVEVKRVDKETADFFVWLKKFFVESRNRGGLLEFLGDVVSFHSVDYEDEFEEEVSNE